MREISSLELYVLVRELGVLAGGRLQRLYQLDEQTLRLHFYSAGKERMLLVQLPARAHLTRYIAEAPKEPTQFAMQLRKHLEGGLVEGVEQHDFDRTFFLRLRRGERKLTLVFELFSHGNCILVGEDGKILSCLRSGEWRDRKIRRGERYVFPALTKADPRELSAKKLADLLSSEKKIISALAQGINLGSAYTEEALLRSGIPFEKKAKELGAGEVERLLVSLREIVEVAESPNPSVFYREGSPVDYALFQLRKHERIEAKVFASLSEAMDEFYASAKSEEGASELEQRKEKLLFTLENQKRSVEELLARAAEAKLAGDGLYERFVEVEEMLSLIREMRRAGSSWEDVERELRKRKGFAGLDPTRGKLILEL